MSMTIIRTDTLSHACQDLSDARIAGQSYPVRVDLDDGTRLDVGDSDEETTTGRQLQVDVTGGEHDGHSFPI